MTGDQADFFQRLRGLLPASWFPDDSPVVDAVLQAPAWALSSNYAQIQYAGLQERIERATDGWLDVVSNDYFHGALPRRANETDASFRARIQANLFIQGPTRGDMAQVMRLLIGADATFIEPSNATDCGGLDLQGGWDQAGRWGDPLPYQGFMILPRPRGGGVPNIGGWDQSALGYDQQGEWTDPSMSNAAVSDAAVYAAIEASRALGTTLWVRYDDPTPAPAPTGPMETAPDTLAPLGTVQTSLMPGLVASLPSIPAGASHALIVLDGTSGRFSPVSTTTPSASVGMPLPAGKTIPCRSDLTQFNIYPYQAGTLTVTYY